MHRCSKGSEVGGESPIGQALPGVSLQGLVGVVVQVDRPVPSSLCNRFLTSLLSLYAVETLAFSGYRDARYELAEVVLDFVVLLVAPDLCRPEEVDVDDSKTQRPVGLNSYWRFGRGT
jgi:hypothetical protein